MKSDINEHDHKRTTIECIKVLYQQSHIIILSNLAASTALALILFFYIPSFAIIYWLLTIYILTILRYVLVNRFNKSKQTSEKIIQYGNYFTFTTIASGCLWGSAGLLFFTPESLLVLFFLTLTLTGTLVASLPSLSAIIHTYYAYAIPTATPLIYKYITYGTFDFALFGTLIFVFLLIQLAYASIHNKTLIKSIILRFENTLLINKLRKQNKTAEAAQLNAEMANISKTKFFAAANHDLRQPLHAMFLFLGVLENEIDNTEHKNILQKIQKSNNTLKVLLDSLLDISKIDAGVIEVNHIAFPIQELLDSLWHEFKSHADEKNLHIKFVPTRIWVNSDPRIVERILRNLISNAIRYTHNGSIIVGCRRRNGNILLSVYDTGIGIPEDRITDIFQEFHQLNNPERDHDKGLGLGLAIVSRMTDLLKTTLHYDSTLNKGSMFAIELPVTNPDPESINISIPWEGHTTLSGKTILIVDDDKEIRDGLNRLLSNWQCTVITATDGNEAIAKLGSGIIKVDLALVDYRLQNGETGKDVLQKINNLYPDNKPPAIIIITGDTAPDRIKEANDSGYRLLHKPLSASKLRAIMSYILTKDTKNTDKLIQ